MNFFHCKFEGMFNILELLNIQLSKYIKIIGDNIIKYKIFLDL
jgi:hypothetical protein